MSSRFFPHKVILTDAVLSLDEDSVLSTNEVSLGWLKPKLVDSHFLLCSDHVVLCFLNMLRRTLLALDETSSIPAEVRFQSQGSNLLSMLEISQMSTCCFLKYVPDLTYVDMEQLGIPQCISPRPAGAAATVKFRMYLKGGGDLLRIMFVSPAA